MKDTMNPGKKLAMARIARQFLFPVIADFYPGFMQKFIVANKIQP